MDVQHAVEVAIGGGEAAVVVQGAAAADVLLGHDDAPAGCLDGFDAGDADLGVEVVVEGVGEEDDGPSGRVGGAAAPGEPLPRCQRREARQGPFAVDARDQFGEPCQAGGLGGDVGDLGDVGGEAGGSVDEATAYA
ncbi:hypothetical protein ACFUAC_19380 [Streptomyces sp. NPDC057148]|uniref:hypothetical protein n=1 Tax=Streptomyces sp. NPDC057148 TaxID=3346035 RepID=UPI0036355582